jgi:hypothetical protein
MTGESSNALSVLNALFEGGTYAKLIDFTGQERYHAAEKYNRPWCLIWETPVLIYL